MTTPLRYDFKTEPYKHQRKALTRIWKLNGRSGVFMPMRTGKTKVVVDWAGICFHNYDLRRVVIVCPIHVIDVWAEQIAQHSSVPYRITVLRQTAARNADVMRELSGHREQTESAALAPDNTRIEWVLVNYEMVWRMLERIVDGDSKAVQERKKKNTLDRVIADWCPDLVVADEAHKLKQYTSRQSVALGRLGQSTKMALGLTGTPFTKWPFDFYSIFRFIDTTVFEQQKWRCWKKGTREEPHEHTVECEGFTDHFGEWAPSKFDPRIDEVKSYKNLDELVRRVRSHSYAITLEDAFPDLPKDPIPQDIKVRMSATAQKLYDELAKEAITWIETHKREPKAVIAENVLVKVTRLSQITSGFVKDEDKVEHDIDDAKLRTCLDLVENIIEQDEKVVVFCRFIHDYERLSAALAKKKIRHSMLTGKTPEKQRSVEIKTFQTNPSVPVFIAQLQSGSVGIDLSAARLSIFYSLGYNWADYIQACQRTLDPRRPRPLGIYRLLVPNSVDVVQRRVMDERTDMADYIVHNPKALLTGDA